MKVIVVGSGSATRDMLRGLGQLWDVTVVDPDPGRLEAAAEVRDITTVVGDGASPAVLEQAGLDGADAFIAAGSADQANLHSCRMAIAAGVPRISAVAADPERLGDYLELGVAAFSPDRLAARQIEINLEPRRVSSAAFGGGMAEAIEFRIAADSPVRGKTLAELGSAAWLAVSVLRGDRLIVPHGGTVIRAGDLVTVVGSLADYSKMVDTFTSGEARFPLDYGRNVVAVLASESDLYGCVAEAAYLSRNTAADALVVLHRRLNTVPDPAEADRIERLLDSLTTVVEGSTTRAVDPAELHLSHLVEMSRDPSVGLLAVPAPSGGRVAGRARAVRMLRAVRSSQVPVLLSRTSHPYRQLVVHVSGSAAGFDAARAGVDLAVFGDMPLVGATAVPPTFIAATETRERLRHAAAQLQEEAAVQGVAVRQHEREGNPVRVVEAVVGEDGLLLEGMPNRAPTFFTPGTVGHLVVRSPSSVLLVPGQD